MTGSNNEVRARLRAQAGRGTILVAGVGSGLTAAGATRGGADLLATYHTAIYRVRNLPSVLAFLPGEDANAITFAVAPEVMAAAGRCPVILGLSAHDPRVGIEALLDRAAALGAAGVTNEPFVGLYGEAMRRELDRAGCGFGREVALVTAAARRGMVTLGWACNAAEAAAMAAAGADVVGAMLGFSLTGAADPTAVDAAVAAVRGMAEAAKPALVVAHGGILNQAEIVADVLRRSGADGYATGSSAERQPVMAAVAAAVGAFKAAASAAPPA